MTMSTNPSPEDSQPPLRVGDPQSLLALLPYLTGFQPHDDLLVVTVADTRLVCVARVDLPTPATDHDPFRAAVDHIATVALRHDATGCLLVGYGPAEPVQVALDLAREQLATTLPIENVLRVEDGRFYHLGCTDPVACPSDGVPLDPTSTVAAATATYAGIAVLPDRDAFARQLAPVTGPARAATVAATRVACHRLAALIARTAVVSDDPPVDLLMRRLIRAGRSALRRTVARYRDRLPLDDTTAAWLTVLLKVPAVRDLAARQISGQRWETDMCIDLLRRADHQFVPGPAILLAICALRGGNNALAGLAIGRALHADPDHTLARLLAQAIEMGVSPDEVAAFFAE